jgi:putative PEP-CTERM system histidine kinase
MGIVIRYIASGIALVLAAGLLFKERRGVAGWSFAVGLVLLALGPLFFALAPGVFLVFSLSFARVGYREYIRRWKYIIVSIFVLPVAALFMGPESVRIFHALVLMAAVLILSNLERTLRASTGYIRWQIKFIVLGMACICASWIYVGSQALIYRELNPSLAVIQPIMLIVGGGFFGWGLTRSRFLNVDVYLSRATIQYSLTALLVSVYLVAVGMLAYFVRYYSPERLLPLDALLLLLALAGMGLLLLSDRLREKHKRFVIRHFKRPLYDYRKAWMDLTEQTNAIIGIHELCGAVARILSRTFGILSVNIWLCDRAGERLTLTGSTVFTTAQAPELERGGIAVAQVLRAVKEGVTLIDLCEKPMEWAEDIMGSYPEYFAEYKMRHILPLRTGEQLVGILTLNDDRVGNAPLSLEDQDLIHAYMAQLAARVLQLRLSEDLRQAQEIEAFQHVSAFFVHDLKNVASRLSLTMQNLPAYFDNPAFRADALRLIGESVSKIDDTIFRLSSLKKIEIRPMPTDLNALVQTILKEFELSANIQIVKMLNPLQSVPIDADQVQKVVINLVMNACDAIEGQGCIRVQTGTRDHHAMVCVSDTGTGMSRQFIEKMLFRPFTSTKKKGMGIGLFHCKMIVDAHNGHIEVDSEEGKGSTFRVLLPM